METKEAIAQYEEVFEAISRLREEYSALYDKVVTLAADNAVCLNPKLSIAAHDVVEVMRESENAMYNTQNEINTVTIGLKRELAWS